MTVHNLLRQALEEEYTRRKAVYATVIHADSENKPK